MPEPAAAGGVEDCALVAGDSDAADAAPVVVLSVEESEPHPESPIPSARAAMAATPARKAIVMSLLSVDQCLDTISAGTKAGSSRSISTWREAFPR
jgi:hypothetical protein